METFLNYIPYILMGLPMTFLLLGGGLALGFAIGLPLAIGHVYGISPIRRIIDIYVWFFRGTPLVVQLFLFYWGVFPALGTPLDAVTTSIIVLGLRSGAYQSQIFRGAFHSVPEGQYIAARAIGMHKYQAIFSIIVPQVLRIAIPPWSNEYAGVLKDTAICFTLGVLEALRRTTYVAVAINEALLPYIFVGFLYLVLTYAGTGLLNRIYERVKIPGLVGRL